MKRRSVLHKQSVKKKKRWDFLALFRAAQGVGSGILKACLLAAVGVGISLSFLSLYSYLLNSPYLRLEAVRVEGVDGKMKQELIALCPGQEESSLLALRLQELKKTMEGHPWVRSVELERRFPHTLVVRAEKEIPVALVLTEKMLYLNRWGEIFKEVQETEGTDLPIITGLSTEGGEMQAQLAKAVRILRSLGSETGLWSPAHLSEIHLGRAGAISLYFSHFPAEIKLTCEKLNEKLFGLRKVTDHLRQKGRIHLVRGIDLDHLGGVRVTFRES